MNQKTFAAIALAGTLALAPLLGCASQQAASEPAAEKTEQTEQVEPAPEEVPTEKEQLAGGWTVTPETMASLSEEEQETFAKATAEYVGAKLEPVTVVATQLVAGTNYAYLCKVTPVTADPTAHWAIAVVYADLEGNASVTGVSDIDLADIKVASDAQDSSELVGAWEVREPSNAAVLAEDAHEAFAKASKNYDGVNLAPVAQLGTQVVAGTNYLVLCQGAPVIQNAKPTLYVAQVYADLEGNAEFTSVQPLDLLAYV